MAQIAHVPLGYLTDPLASEKILDVLTLQSHQENSNIDFAFAMSPFLGSEKQRNKGILESGLTTCQEFFDLHRLTPDQFPDHRDHVIHNVNSLDNDTSVAF